MQKPEDGEEQGRVEKQLADEIRSTQNSDVTPPGLGLMTRECQELNSEFLGATKEVGNAGIDVFCSVGGAGQWAHTSVLCAGHWALHQPCHAP